MIKSLSIQNYQSHKDTTLNFDKGVNIIIGESDSGKTAILRAFNWAVNNKPAGDTFRSNWGGDTSVVLVTDDNSGIMRLKTKVRNEYELTTNIGPDGEISEYKAFGQDVPEQIKQAINIDSINFQYQLDAPFLLSDSPGEVARQLNDIVNLNVIDSSLANIGRMIRQNNQGINTERTRLEDLQAELKKYDYLNKLEKNIEKTEKKKQVVVEQMDQSNILTSLTAEFESQEEQLLEIGKILKAEAKVIYVGHMIDQRQELIEQSMALKILGTDMSYKTKVLKEIGIILPAEKQMNGVFKLIGDRGEVVEQYKVLNDLTDRIRVEEANIGFAKNNFLNYTSAYDSLIPDVCPLCGQEIT